MKNTATVLLELTRNLSRKTRFRNEQELMTYQKGLEFAESYINLCKIELDKAFKNDNTTEDI